MAVITVTLEEKMKHLALEIWLVELEIIKETRTSELERLNLRHGRLKDLEKVIYKGEES